MIQLDLKDPKPLYEQIKEKIKELIISGVLQPDAKIPSVRELAQMLTINPNTIQKSYKDLESEGIIYSVKGKGNFIATLDMNSVNIRRGQLLAEIARFTEELIYLQTPEQTVIDLVSKTYKQKGESK